MAFDKTLCAYCNDELSAGDHSFCLKRLQTGTPQDRRDPWTAYSIVRIKRNTRRMVKRTKNCLVCGTVFTRKGKYCKPSCTGKAYRDRKAASEGRAVKAGAPRARHSRKVAA